MKTLYKLSPKTGKIQTWGIDVTGDYTGAIMTTYSGVNEGKLRENIKAVGPSKTNTDAFDRAENLVFTKYKNKLQSGYHESIEEAKDAPAPKSPMHALRIDHKDINKVPLPCYGEVKRNGFCGWYDHNSPDSLLSRTLKYQDVPHIREQICELIKGTDIRFVHFEIYVDGWPLTRISRAIKKENEDTPLLQAHIFDVVTEDGKVPQDARVQERGMLFKTHPELEALVNVHSVHLKNVPQLENFYKIACKAEEEGVVFRPWKDVYQFDNKTHRSTSLIKMKPKYSGEYTVKSITYLKTKEMVNDKLTTYMLAEFHCEHEGSPFKVIPAMPHLDRHQMFLDRVSAKDLTGPVTVEYREVSEYNVPQHAVAVGFREDYYKEDVRG